jgi:membrane-associated protease RseP (regulator of RpoE activity)
MEPAWLLIAFAFGGVTGFLFNCGAQRYYIAFLVRSRLGLKFIESLAKVKPGLWCFLADFSVVLSFAGVGAYYLSSHRQTRGNLYKSLIFLAFLFALAALAFGSNYLHTVGFLFAALSVPVLIRQRNAVLDFLYTVSLFTLACSMVFNAGVSILLGVFGLPAIMVYVLMSHGLDILSARTDLPGVSPLIPSTRGGRVGVSFPGYGIFIPWWYALTALFITLVSHEAAHGVLTKVAGVRLKSTGLLFLLGLPIGAFVEPDEEELDTRDSVDRMRIYTMGSFANMAVFAVAGLLLLAFMSSVDMEFQPDGMKVVSFMEGYPAEGVLVAGTVIKELNGASVRDRNSFSEVSGKIKPGDAVVVSTSDGVYELTAVANPDDASKGYLGVFILQNVAYVGPMWKIFVSELLQWIAFFNINIALVNLLPAVPFDGGRMFKEFISTFRMSEVNVNRMLYAVLAFMVLLLFINFIPVIKSVMTYVVTLL